MANKQSKQVAHNLQKDYQDFLLEMKKLQTQQRKIFTDYADRLRDIKLQKIKNKLSDV